jgi:hypothetical protein
VLEGFIGSVSYISKQNAACGIPSGFNAQAHCTVGKPQPSQRAIDPPRALNGFVAFASRCCLNRWNAFIEKNQNKRGNLSATPKNEALTISAKRKPVQLVFSGGESPEPLEGNNTQQQRKQ